MSKRIKRDELLVRYTKDTLKVQILQAANSLEFHAMGDDTLVDIDEVAYEVARQNNELVEINGELEPPPSLIRIVEAVLIEEWEEE